MIQNTTQYNLALLLEYYNGNLETETRIMQEKINKFIAYFLMQSRKRNYDLIFT